MDRRMPFQPSLMHFQFCAATAATAVVAVHATCTRIDRKCTANTTPTPRPLLGGPGDPGCGRGVITASHVHWLRPASQPGLPLTYLGTFERVQRVSGQLGAPRAANRSGAFQRRHQRGTAVQFSDRINIWKNPNRYQLICVIQQGERAIHAGVHVCIAVVHWVRPNPSCF